MALNNNFSNQASWLSVGSQQTDNWMYYYSYDYSGNSNWGSFITTDYDSFDYVDISYKTHPKWRVVDAVYASCCLPVLFSPFYEEDNKMRVYLDGGIRMNYPLKVCLDDGCHPSEILGIRRIDPDDVKNNKILPSFSLFDIIYKIFNQYTKKIEIEDTDTQIQCQYDIPFSSMDLNAIFKCLSNEEERISLIEMGIQSSLSKEEK